MVFTIGKPAINGLLNLSWYRKISFFISSGNQENNETPNHLFPGIHQSG
ncbi:Uncharacterized protein dnl_06320 [Desulfonema limicola]|uniref:Uncharacterized protein n=1 Tax=Desulfonema limicola TaxID=45656 RepID=A0A975B443_9BACT|nr:Uncharacterized protein dnl_06320 [Desulfonema limicola]